MSALNIDALNKLQLQTQDLVGRSTAVLGITGSGKTNTTSVLIEELLASGLPLTIVDIEGEYWGLKEQFEILVAGRSVNAEVEVAPTNAGQLADISIRRGISVILDLSDFSQNEIYEFLMNYFTSLWEASSITRRPYQIILEEAHEFVPQGMNNPLKQLLARLALRGRKRGLGIILVSQRSAKVEKDLLTQASLLFLHKVMHPVDLRVYKDLIPLSSSEVEENVRLLQPGQVIVVSNFATTIVSVRLRHTFHVGATPTYEVHTQPKLRKIDNAILQELRELTLHSVASHALENEQSKLMRRVKELEEEIVAKDAEIEHLKNQVELLSRLTVSLENLPANMLGASAQSLEVAQALVGQVITAQHQQLPSSPDSHAFFASSAISGVRTGQAEQRKLDALVRRLQKLPRLQRAILRLLSEHEGIGMTASTIATWLSLKESTIRSRPPHDLLKMKLITRTRGSHGYKYTSTFSTFLKREFPETEPAVIADNLWRRIDESLSGERDIKK
jgi:hypothetical protein